MITSIPAYIAGKIVTAGRASFGDAMAATLGGVLVYAIVVFAVGYFLQPLVGASAGIWAVLLGFIAWLAVYRASFDTGWLGAFGIAIVAVLVVVAFNAMIGAALGVSFPLAVPFRL